MYRNDLWSCQNSTKSPTTKLGTTNTVRDNQHMGAKGIADVSHINSWHYQQYGVLSKIYVCVINSCWNNTRSSVKTFRIDFQYLFNNLLSNGREKPFKMGVWDETWTLLPVVGEWLRICGEHGGRAATRWDAGWVPRACDNSRHWTPTGAYKNNNVMGVARGGYFSKRQNHWHVYIVVYLLMVTAGVTPVNHRPRPKSGRHTQGRTKCLS